MKFWFCETCGKRLTDKDIEDGAARNKKLKGVFCQQCSVGVMTMEMDAVNIERLAKAAPESPSHSSTASDETRAPPRKASGIIRAHTVTQRHAPGRSTVAAKPDRLPVLLAMGAIVVVGGVVALAIVKNQPAPRDHESPAPLAGTPAKISLAPPPPAPVATVPEQAPLNPTPPVVPEKLVEAPHEPPKNALPGEQPPPVASAQPRTGAEAHPTAALTEAHPPEHSSQPVAIRPVDPAVDQADDQGHAQFAAMLKEMSPFLRKNNFSASLEMLDARRRDPALAGCVELIDKAKSDLSELQALHARAFEALRAKSGAVVTLKKGTINGTVKAGANKDDVTLTLREGPELVVSASVLDADDVCNLLPLDAGAGRAKDLRLRGVLYLTAGDQSKAEAYFAQARDAGLDGASLNWIATVKWIRRETAASEAWKRAEELFANKSWKSARQAYEALHRDFAGSALLANNAETFTKRMEALDEALGPARELSLELGGGMKMELQLIPAGEFEMGAADGDAMGKPVHKVKLSRSFYMGKYVVTQAQYAQVTGKKPSHFAGDNLPVESVNYFDAEEFCKQAGKRTGMPFRLPTEAEWEYACRAGTKTKYIMGDDDAVLDQMAWFRINSEGKTHPVGQKKPNAWGLYDMIGNVWEWCHDWLQEDYYAKSPAVDPEGPTKGIGRVLRGGAWNRGPWPCRSGNRFPANPDVRDEFTGFRVVVSPASGAP